MVIWSKKKTYTSTHDSITMYISDDTLREEFTMKDGNRNTRMLHKVMRVHGINPDDGYTIETVHGDKGQFYIQTKLRMLDGPT